VLLLLAACASRTPPPSLASELIAMKDADQEVRRRWIEDRENPELKAEVKQVDATNLARLKQIVRRYGWPGKGSLGMKAAGAAWTIAQHADAAFQREVLPLMEKAVAKGDLAPGLYATTIDRVLVADGKPQRYGSQFDTSEGRCEPLPLEDPAHVDERRSSMGLGSLAEFTKQLCHAYGQKK
jgi:hypothetical protein